MHEDGSRSAHAVRAVKAAELCEWGFCMRTCCVASIIAGTKQGVIVGRFTQACYGKVKVKAGMSFGCNR